MFWGVMDGVMIDCVAWIDSTYCCDIGDIFEGFGMLT